jgi:hypothetical protein
MQHELIIDIINVISSLGEINFPRTARKRQGIWKHFIECLRRTKGGLPIKVVQHFRPAVLLCVLLSRNCEVYRIMQTHFLLSAAESIVKNSIPKGLYDRCPFHYKTWIHTRKKCILIIRSTSCVVKID